MSEIQAPASAEPAPRQGRGRTTAVWAVLVIAGLLLLLTSFAVWVNRVALNTQVFADTSGELLDNDAIRSTIATRAVDELFDNVDVQAEVEAKLPGDVKSLSGPATAALRQASYQIVDRALEQPAFHGQPSQDRFGVCRRDPIPRREVRGRERRVGACVAEREIAQRITDW